MNTGTTVVAKLFMLQQVTNNVNFARNIILKKLLLISLGHY